MIKQETMMSLLNMVNGSKNELIIRLANGGITITENRNYLVAQALQNDCDYLFMCDDDMVFPSRTLETLIGHDKDICGVYYHARRVPLAHTVEMFDEAPQGDLYKVKALGGGIMLIKTKVLLNMPQPWFDTEEYSTGMAKVAEDNWFCYEAGKAGFEVWCDSSLDIKHVGDYLY